MPNALRIQAFYKPTPSNDFFETIWQNIFKFHVEPSVKGGRGFENLYKWSQSVN